MLNSSAHVPNSSGVKLLVTVSVKTRLKITPIKPPIKAISPEYVTRILLNLSHLMS